MDAPFEGATTRSRSQNYDATQTVRTESEPALGQDRDRETANARQEAAWVESDGGSDLTNALSGEEDRREGEPRAAARPTEPPADLEERLEEGRQAVAQLEQRVWEA